MHDGEQGVAAGDGKPQDRIGELLLKCRRVEMGGNMVDRDKRFVPRPGQRLGRRDADEREPTSPGLLVTAIRSMCSGATPASSMADG
jgi:hypothetical protein